MRHLKCFVVGTAGLVLLLATSVCVDATDTTLTFGQLPAADHELDLSIPESPAFAALGLSPEDVIRPATPRALAASVLNAFDKQGNFQSGLALDSAVYMLARGNELTIQEYRDNYLKRFLARTQLSAASTKGFQNDDEAVRAAVGLRMVPYDDGDPRLNVKLDECFTAEIPPPPPPNPGENIDQYQARVTGAAVAELEGRVAAIAQSCRERAAKEHWNDSAVELGAAPTWIQRSGKSDDLQFGGASFWSSAAYSVRNSDDDENPVLVVLQARFQLQQDVASPDDSDVFFEQDSLDVGTKVRFGSRTLPVSLEGSYLYEDPDGQNADHAYRFAAGLELPFPFGLLKDSWLQVNLGGTGGRDDGNQIFLSSTIKFGDGTEADLTRVAAAIPSVVPH